jgi:ABC-type multidrug transport system fused ATPase/permease subunit
MNISKKIMFLLTPYERKKAIMLMIMILIMSIADLVGIGSIFPFVTVISNPDTIETNKWIYNIYKFSFVFGVKNAESFLIFLGVSVFILLILSLVIKIFTTYLELRFVQMREYTISKFLVENYMLHSYQWFLNNNSAELGKNILSETNQITSGGLKPLINIVSKFAITILIVSLLLFTDPKLTMIVSFVIGSAYSLLFILLRNYLKKLGEDRLKNNELRYLAVNQAFSGIKDVKIKGLEKFYLKLFSNSAYLYAHTQANRKAIAELPRFFFEAIAFGGILLILLYMMAITGSFNNSLPTLTLYAFAGYRLIPALQQIYKSFTQLKFNDPAINKLYNDVKNFEKNKADFNQENFSIDKEIILENINFSYPNSEQRALKDINIKIPINSTVGIIGKTGSGKTTIVDIILGLLEPQSGVIKINGITVTKKNLKSLRKSVGYVTQQVYLTDATVESNIALGIDPNSINKEAVIKACKIANIHDFINDLPKKYKTVIGENGVRLSGGQRQRLAIARAFYNDPKILIFDEATSALDDQTEQLIMDAIYSLGQDITIIIIAHRLNTVKNCDLIFKLEKGKIISKGAPHELMN